MPRISAKRGKVTQALAVSPWMHAKGLGEQPPPPPPPQQQQQQHEQQHEPPGEQRMYSVVVSDAAFAAALRRPAEQRPAAEGEPRGAPRAAAAWQHGARGAAEPSRRSSVSSMAASDGGGWHHACRGPHPAAAATGAAQQQQQQQQQRLERKEQEEHEEEQQKQEEGEEEEEEEEGLLGAEGSQAGQQHSHKRARHGPGAAPELLGVAQLALLPSGAVAGQFAGSAPGAAAGQPRVCVGLRSRVALAAHSCYRDVDWSLLEVQLVRPAAGGGGEGGIEGGAAAAGEAEASAWVQRTGGDLVALEPADMGDEDTAAAVLSGNLGLPPPFALLRFSARTLLDGAAADRLLACTWPALVGSGVVLNLGEMELRRLPAGFLQPQRGG